MNGWTLGRVVVTLVVLIGCGGTYALGLLGVDGVVGLLVLALTCLAVGWIIGRITR